MPLQREEAGDLLRGGGAGVARDEIECQVVDAPELTSSSRRPQITSTRSG